MLNIFDKGVEMGEKKSIQELFTLLEESINNSILKNEKYKESISRRDKKSDLIETCFTKEESEILEEYLEIENEISIVKMEEAFVSGFSLAFQLIIDSLR